MQAIQSLLRFRFDASTVTRISRVIGSVIVRSFRSHRATVFGATPSVAARAAWVNPARVLSRRSWNPSTGAPLPLLQCPVHPIRAPLLHEAVDGGGADANVLPGPHGRQVTAADELVHVLLGKLEDLSDLRDCEEAILLR